MKKLLIGTKRKGKIKEIKALLKDLPFKILTLKDINLPKNFKVVENGRTFRQNAIKKAKSYGDFSKILTLVDDSGLCVKALFGKPGVRSARYQKGSDRDRINKLLAKLKKTSSQKRNACFVCVAALYNPENGKIKTTQGKCPGQIIKAPQGKKGFGYDPVFYLPLLKKTLAQVSLLEKNKHSHRAQAIKKIKPHLKKIIKNA